MWGNGSWHGNRNSTVNGWKVLSLALLLTLSIVCGYRIFMWRLWVIDQANKATAVHAYLVEPITMPDGKVYPRHQILDALMANAIAGAKPK